MDISTGEGIVYRVYIRPSFGSFELSKSDGTVLETHSHTEPLDTVPLLRWALQVLTSGHRIDNKKDRIVIISDKFIPQDSPYKKDMYMIKMLAEFYNINVPYKDVTSLQKK